MATKKSIPKKPPVTEPPVTEIEVIQNQPPVNEVEPPVTEPPVTEIEVIKNAEPVNEVEPPATKQENVVYSFKLTVEESNHVESIYQELLKFKVVDNKADWLKKCVDIYCNYNAVCKDLNLNQPLIIPVPNGKNNSADIQPKLLKNSLLKPTKVLNHKIPSF